MHGEQSRYTFYSGVVWIFSAVALSIYGALGLFGQSVPGAEELIAFLSSLSGWHIIFAAFVAIGIEGLYWFGSFFPGGTLVAVLAILSHSGGLGLFLLTILTIFLGWCMVGAVNIFLALRYRDRVLKLSTLDTYVVRGRPWATWFPSFRANYEVAQVMEGGDPWKVFFSSVHVKLYTSLVMGVITFTMPFFFSLDEVSNRDGFVGIAMVAAISYAVGFFKLRTFFGLGKRSVD